MACFLLKSLPNSAQADSRWTLSATFCGGGGDIAAAPAPVGHSSCWDAEHSFLMLGLEPTFFAVLLMNRPQARRIQTVPRFYDNGDQHCVIQQNRC